MAIIAMREELLHAQCERGGVEGPAEQIPQICHAAGKLRLPKVRLDVKQLLKISTGRVAGNKAIQAIAADREEKL